MHKSSLVKGFKAKRHLRTCVLVPQLSPLRMTLARLLSDDVSW